jgi:hypothetical protein
MSALPPKADIAERDHDVRFVPKADLADQQRQGNSRRRSGFLSAGCGMAISALLRGGLNHSIEGMKTLAGYGFIR